MTQSEAVHKLAAVTLVCIHLHGPPRGAVVVSGLIVVPRTRTTVPIGVRAIELGECPAECSTALDAQSPRSATRRCTVAHAVASVVVCNGGHGDKEHRNRYCCSYEDSESPYSLVPLVASGLFSIHLRSLSTLPNGTNWPCSIVLRVNADPCSRHTQARSA